MNNIVFAKYKTAKGSVRKINLVLRLIRGMNVQEAMQTLPFVEKKASEAVLKTLQSAVANAKNNFSLEEETLFVAVAEAGLAMKAFRPRFTRGRVRGIERRWSHIKIGVAPMQAVEAPVKKAKASAKKITTHNITKAKK